MALKKQTTLILSVAILLFSAFPASSEEQAWEQALRSAEESFTQGRLEQAFEQLKQAQSKAPDDASRAAILNQLGVMKMNQRHFLDAQAAFKEALDLREKALPANDSATLQTASNLALATYKLGDEVGAERMYLQTIERKRSSQPGTASLAISLTNLANLYADHRRCSEAKSLYIEALDIDRKLFGDKHSETANDLFNLGAMLHRCNEFAEALTYLEQAQTAYAAVSNRYGEVKALHYMALCESALKHHEKAAALAQRALNHHEGLKGKGHGDTIVHILNAADSYDASGKIEEAEKLYKQSVEIADRFVPVDNLRIVESNLELAQFFRRHHRFEEAEHYYKRALVHYDQLSKKDKRALYELPLAYSQMLAEQKRTEESEKLARKYLHVYVPTAARN